MTETTTFLVAVEGEEAQETDRMEANGNPEVSVKAKRCRFDAA